jgi:8-oxo-dGTP pyrophosphatase MutT (NUDIX family)
MNLLDTDALVAHLRKMLAGPLPGLPAQMSMSPPYRADLVARVEANAWRDAAVLIAIRPTALGPSLILTARSTDLRHHPGQVSFPGGRVEKGESFEVTALREAEEEIGLAPSEVEILGSLTPLHVPPSRFCIYPFVAAIHTDTALCPCDVEVAAILHAPIAELADPATRRNHMRRFGDVHVEVPCFDVEGYEVWGATAMILAELLAILGIDSRGGAPIPPA